MSKKDLTAKGVANLPLSDEGKKKAHLDAGGLYVVCEPGAKGINRSYNFRFTFAGKEAWHRMGTIADLTLQAARNKAREYRVMVNEGKDPRRFIDTTAAGQETFRSYLDKHWEDITGGAPRDDYKWSYAVGKVEALHNMPIGAITNDDVHKAIKKFWYAHPSSGQAVLHKAGKVFRHAKARKLRLDNPAAFDELRDLGLAPAREVKPIVHHNALRFVELPAFMHKLAYQPEITARCLEWCILTGARSGEAREARWEWLSPDMTTLTIPGAFMKTGEAHVVPLPTQLTAMLAKLPRTGELIFPSQHTFGVHKPLLPHALLTMANRVLGLEGKKGTETIKVHGFRSTFRDWAAVYRVEEDWVLELCLAHDVGSAVRGAYQRDAILERRRAVMQAFADYATGKSVVVPFAKTA